MKRIVETEEKSLESLLGEQVLLMCANYFYAGKLTGVNESCVELTEPKIVYETGAWDGKSFADAQEMHTNKWYVSRAAIESFGQGK